MKLERSIGYIIGTSYCVTIIIGAGVLGLPGAAAHLAGPNSVYAWAFDFLLVLPLLYVFSRLINAAQSAGGIADFIKVAFGPNRIYRFAQVLLLVTLVVGTAAIALVGAQYLGSALGWSPQTVSLAAIFFILVPTLINSLGVRLSGKVQSIAALALVLFLLSVIASSFPEWTVGRALSFDSQRLSGTWQAMGLVWFAFTGIEMISFLGEEFKSPLTFIMSVVSAIIIVGFIYIGLAIATKLVVPVNDPLLMNSPLVAILKRTLGARAGNIGSLLGSLIILINLTGAILGASRLIFSVGREGYFLPKSIGELNHRGVPLQALVFLSVLSAAMVFIIGLLHWSLEPVFLFVSQNWFVLYALAILSFLKLETSTVGRSLGVLSLIFACIFMSAFSWFLIVPLVIAVFIYFQGRSDKAPYVG